MEIYFSRRKALVGLLLVLGAVGAALFFLKMSGRSLAQAVGFDSGRGAALAGVKVFYSVDYHDGQDVWAARLCALSTEPACDFYQNTVAPFLWPEFDAHQTLVTAEAGDPVMLAEELAGTRGNAPMQVWQVAVTLSAPWPQGDGQTSFPAHILVVREESGWKFERFLLEEELDKYTGGKQ
jgi:hypothetical protein